MKNVILINNFRKIRKSYKRFLSLMFLSLLGVGFFVGIKAASPDMLRTIDNYFDLNNVYDIEIVSSLGLTDSDVESVSKLKNIDTAIGVKSIDFVATINDEERNIKITEITDINKVILKKGSLPSKKDEIVVEEKLLKENKLKIGDSIFIPSDALNDKTYKIVGTVDSPLFFSTQRGTSTVGDGKLDYLTYVLEEAFNLNYYSSIYVTLDGAKEKLTSSPLYLDILDKALKEIDDLSEEREEIRFKDLFGKDIEKMESMGVTVDLDNFPKSTWYTFDRDNNLGYSTYIDACSSLEQIGNVFPLVFYIVAILISLISMTRMVDEDRLEIGTLKGLGFSNWHIISNYLMYSFLATTIGGIIGMVIGVNLFPRIIWKIYETIFYIPSFICEFNLWYAFIGLVVALICICGATCMTAITSLREKASNLMRPKVPKIGRKIFLERFSIIWKRFNFSQKITVRNIFRYKKRVIVTIVGITFSTALILVGFGLKDSVVSIRELNYKNVHVYDKMISLKQDSDVTALTKLLDENKEIISFVFSNNETINLYNEDMKYVETNLIVPEEKDKINDVIKLNDINNDYKKASLKEREIVLSEKLARLLEVSVGDEVLIFDDNEYIHLKVSNIVENYINNYVFITKKTYEDIFKDYKTNTVFYNVSDNYDDVYDEKIVSDLAVSGLVSKESIADLIGNVLDTLNSVVVILIVSSAILAFVILYNLANINISERRREISTLKVLGFYDEEVDAYIMKETYFITVVGIMFGLFIGQYLSYYVISTCEPQFVMFIRHVEWESYVISAVISLVFTLIVNRITHINLRKINMVESLKSCE